jgi:hypothetical protein
MNLIKKLSELGWKQTNPVKIGRDPNYERIIVDDIYEEIYISGKKTTIKKKFGKYEKFYYNKIGIYEIWLKASKDDLIHMIVKENNLNGCIPIIYETLKPCIKSKQDIINILPKLAKRNITIEQLFK